jgi:hypothetical protein
MLIGDVSAMEMAPVLRRLEKAVDRQVNPTIFSGDDFVKNLARKNPLSAGGYAGKENYGEGN